MTVQFGWSVSCIKFIGLVDNQSPQEKKSIMILELFSAADLSQ